jgi:hemerythrin
MDKIITGVEKKEWRSLFTHNVLIVWDHKYDLGIPIVDEQHRGIVSTINSLYYGMQNAHGKEMLNPVIEMVKDYTRIHFEIEEDFLNKCGYPDFKAHQELHHELINEISGIGRKSLWDKDPQEFLGFLKTWWIDHICKKDNVFRDYLRIKM